MFRSLLIISLILLASTASVDETKQVVDGILGTDFATTVGQNIPKCIDEWAQAADLLGKAIYDFTDGDWPEGIALIGEILIIVPDIKSDCFDEASYSSPLIEAFSDPAAFQLKEMQAQKQVEVFTQMAAAEFSQGNFQKTGKVLGYTIDFIDSADLQ